jgi:uncharacterized membrane protein YdcZ (DUF606 family)
MRWYLLVVGILLILIGAVWALQGEGLLAYGQMAGHSRWTYIGAVLAAAGIALTVLGARRKGGRAAPPA